MKRIITYGTYDLFHAGHVRLFKRLKEDNCFLIVGVSTDEFNEEKGKKSIFSYEERKTIVEACKYVDLVIPESSWEQKRNDVIQHNIDVFAMGDDWQGKFDDLSELCEVKYLSRTQNISTTDVRKAIISNKLSHIDDVIEVMEETANLIKNLRQSLK
ncbi:glycerol-3-phosphate cytidylyltransferase [Vibrio alfacsensis]|uniref:glycerol-3-phosphate cytidylyltransferase n=1 Tax=Vibrio TaxID=662 RepID=UPI00406837D1